MAADQDLLFGLLALQNGLIDQGQLVAAFRSLALDQDRPLAEHFVGLGLLDADARASVEAMVALHLKNHDGDAEQSYATLPVGQSTRELLAALKDPETTTVVAAPRPAASASASGGRAGDGQRFRVLRPHARGGLGAVYVAVDSELNREVALKSILDHHADDPVSRQRFLLEAEVTGGLEHPGIVPVYGLGAYPDGRPYYAMRFIRGDSLQEAVARFHRPAGPAAAADPANRSLELRKLLRRFLDVCNAIEYAHSRGVLHRDIKPGNIIVGTHGETLVVDWGLAKPLGRADPSHQGGERTLVPSPSSGSADTLPGAALGTPAYMSPEQASGDLDRLGPRSDVYSLGATLYCLLTGRPPFEGSVTNVLDRVRRGEFAPPRQADPSVDRALEAVCLKAMATDPDDRYASCRALAEDVERWTADEPVSAYREPWRDAAARWVRRRRTTAGVALAVLVSAVVGLGAVAVVTARANRQVERRRAEAVASAREADRNYRIAREAIDAAFTKIGEQRLMDEPGMEGLRADLLAAPIQFYSRFAAERKNDAVSQLDLATILARLAHIRISLALRAEARADLDRAAGILRRVEADPPPGVKAEDVLKARTRVDWALREFLARTGDLDAALGVSERLEADYQRLATIEPGEPRHRIARLVERNSRALSLWRKGRLDEAKGLVESSLKEYATIPADASDFEFLDLGGRLHSTLGRIVTTRADFPRAVDETQAAVDVYRRLVRDDPKRWSWRIGLATGLNSQAIALRKLGRRDEAERRQRENVEALRRLTADFPGYPSFRENLATNLNNLSIFRREANDLAETERLNREAIQILESVVAGAPGVVDYLRTLGASEGNFGNLVFTRKGYAEALDWFDRSIEHLLRVRDRVGDGPEETVFLRNGYWGRADALAELGRVAEACEALDRARSFASGTDAAEIEANRALLLARRGDAKAGGDVARALLARPDLTRYCFGLALEALVTASSRAGDERGLGEAESLLRSDRGRNFLGSYGNRKAVLVGPEWAPLRGLPGLEDWVLDLGFPEDPFRPAEPARPR